MRIAISITLAKVIAFLVTGCGGGDDDDGASTRSNSTVNPSPASPAAPSSNATQTTGGTGGGSQGGSQVGDVDACSLLTPEEIGEVYQAEIGAGEPERPTNSNASACMWPGLYLEVLPSGGQAWYDTVNFGQNPEPVDDLGDKAGMTSAGTLDVVDGDAYISLQVITGPFLQIDRPAASRQLAEIVLSKLP